MKGINEIVINTATLAMAVEEYFNRRATSKGEIRIISVPSSPGGVFKFAVKGKE